MGMEGLGRAFNAVPIGHNVWIDLRDASGVTFLIHDPSGGTVTLDESPDGDTSQDLEAIDRWYTGTGTAGTWTLNTRPSPADDVVFASNAAAVFVGADQLSDGYRYVRCVGGTATAVVAVLHDLSVQRDPAELTSLAPPA